MRKKYIGIIGMGIMLLGLLGSAACGKESETMILHTPTPTMKLVPTIIESVEPTNMPEPTESVEPTNAPEPTKTVEPTKVPEPTKTVEPTNAPEPTKTVEPTKAAEPTNAPEPTKTVEPTATPTPTPVAIQNLPAELAAVVEKAERMAAGYDYIGAIDYLKSYEEYEESEEIQQLIQHYTELDGQLVSLTKAQMNTVPHLFVHSLIYDTSRAFDNDEDTAGYNMYMTTVDEFNKMMQQMYDRGYVLVSPYDIAYEVSDENGTRMVYGDIRLPEGKKPFILSQDDVNYYAYMVGSGNGKGNTPALVDRYGDGFATKIVIDENGKLACEYVDMDGNVSVGAYDMVPLLEQFIEEHPDFSYHGAKGILAFTGYEGVLGYRTKPAYEETLGTEAYQQEVAQAKAVAECLRENGWLLASHTYGHISCKTNSLNVIKNDNTAWVNTVASIIGETDILIYPYGSDIKDWTRYTFDNAKYKYLYDAGYRYFFNVDGNAGWMQITDHSFRGGRVCADGNYLWNRPDLLEPFFDAESVIDPLRPTPVEG